MITNWYFLIKKKLAVANNFLKLKKLQKLYLFYMYILINKLINNHLFFYVIQINYYIFLLIY